MTAKPRFDANGTRDVSTMDLLTAKEIRRSVKPNKAHYADLKDDKQFGTWNRGFAATAHMHHTEHVLDETYVPTTEIDIAVFKETQTFMYAVLEDHLKTDKGKSLVSQFESTRDAQGIYRELKKHALSSTAAQLSGDTLLQYTTTTQYPGSWRGSLYGFLLHWKEKVMKYERLELETFPLKQTVRILQNAVGDASELAYVKQIGDQDIARGNPPLTYKSYMELLLYACSTFDKKITLPGKQQRAGYTTAISASNYLGDKMLIPSNFDSTIESKNATDNSLLDDGDPIVKRRMFTIDPKDLTVRTFFKNAEDDERFGNNSSNGQSESTFLLRKEWKMTQKQKDSLIAKRRQERMTLTQANVHAVGDFVGLDNIIYYPVLHHDAGTTNVDTDNQAVTPGSNDLLAYMAGRGSYSGYFRHVLAAKQAPDKSKSHTATEHMEMVPYRVVQHDVATMEHALVNRGANGGICGNGILVLDGSERFVDVFGLAGHKVCHLRIFTAQVWISTHKGDAIIATFHQMALLGKGTSFLSCLQMAAYGADINDRSRLLPGGKPRILMDGCQVPLDFQNVLDWFMRNQRLSPLGGETTSNYLGDKTFICSKSTPENSDLSSMDGDPSIERRMVTIDPNELIGKTFRKDCEENVQCLQACVVCAVVDKEDELKKGSEYIKFICEIPNSTFNEFLEYIERDNNDEENKFCRIRTHQGPSHTSDKDYKRITFNVLVKWENGETTYEPLDLIASDDPVTCVAYGKQHGLLDTPEWKCFRCHAKNDKKLQHMIDQAKLICYRREPFWKFGVLVPCAHAQALELDKKNGNVKWQDAEATEMSQLLEYNTFVDKGIRDKLTAGYKKIQCHIIYDVKHDGRHKARFVAGGYLTNPNTESVYSGRFKEYN
jgi:hypothetical protein